MEKKKFLWEDAEINFPSEEEQNQALQRIVDQAYPEQKSFLTYLWELVRQLNYAVWNHGILFMFFMTSAGYLLLLALKNYIEAASGRDSLMLMVLFAPMMFQTVFLLSLWNEKSQDMEELQLSCKYTLYHILLLRMLLICVMEILLQWSACILLYYDTDLSVLLHSALFLTAMILLYCILVLWSFLKKEIWNWQIGLGIAWCLLHLALWKMMPVLYTQAVFELPFLLDVGLSLLFLCILFRMLRKCFQLQHHDYADSMIM